MHVETAARVVNSLESFVSFAKTKQKIAGRLLKNKKGVKKNRNGTKCRVFTVVFLFFASHKLIHQFHSRLFLLLHPCGAIDFFLLTVVVCIRGVVWAGL